MSLTYLREFQVPLPPIEEQQRIVDRVDELMKQIDEYEKIEQQLISLKDSFPGDLRSAILQAAMQGKLTEQLDTDSSVDELISVIVMKREGLLEDGAIDKPIKTPEIKEEEIPYAARIVSVADAYHALISDRPYRKGLGVEKACDIMQSGAGTLWDAELVRKFIQIAPALATTI